MKMWKEGARAGFGARLPDNFIGGLAESKSVTYDGVTLTRTDKELTANDYTFSGHLLTIKTAGNYTLSGTASSKDFRVKVGDRLVTTLTIDNLTINTVAKRMKVDTVRWISAKQGNYADSRWQGMFSPRAERIRLFMRRG
ncbi:MAG: hypothetical protein ACLUMK_00175 [Christensenellales bacterium]